MKKIVFGVLILVLMAVPAMAKTTFTFPATYGQDNFKTLSTELGLAISYDPLSPAEPLGGLLPGFDAGVEMTAVKVNKDSASWSQAVQGSALPSYLPFAKVHVQVGLPVIPLDLGVMYSELPNTDVKLIGGELKYAILKGGIAMPAIALRAAYTKLSGIDVLDMETKSLDLSISKGFLILTPYAGIGEVWITSTPKGSAVTVANLKKEDISQTKEFVGAKLTFFPFMNLVAEADFAKVNAYSLRLNVHF
jgi:hypothetical protein